MKFLRLTAVGLLVAATVTPASALTSTNTNGKICRNEPCHVETFSGGYIFRGTTRPSQRGQTVRFYYRRAGTQRWHAFGKPGSKKIFVSVDGTPWDRINSGHAWREHFDINGFVGYPHRRWILMAKFVRQDGFSVSTQRVRVRAAYGD